MTGIWAAKIRKVQDYKGYLIFVIVLNSVYLSPDHDVAQWSCVVITQPHAGDFGTYEVSKWPYPQ